MESSLLVCISFPMRYDACMSAKKIITIAGKLGSGKSTTAKKIAQELNLEHFSSGDFLRKLAEQKDITLQELLNQAETNPQIDTDIDTMIASYADKENIIIDSRLAYHWIPDSFKVYLEIDPEVAAERMYTNLLENESRKKTEDSSSVEEMKQKMIKRHEGDVRRYAKLYNINHTDHSNFDLVVNTGYEENNLEEVVKKIVDGYKKHVS